MVKKMIPPEQETDGLSNLRRKLDAYKGHASGKVMTEQEILDGEYISERVAIGVTQAFELIMTDERLLDAFWHRGYQSFVTRGGSDTKRWAGSGIIRAFVFSLCLWIAVLAVKNVEVVK